jgi:hypothetical protein
VRRLGGVAGMYELKNNDFFSFFMYLSSKHAEMHSNTLLLPFLLKENACF